MTALKPITAHELKRRLDVGDATLIDIREPGEHANENIAAASLHPLSCFVAEAINGEGRRAVVFHCKSGMRTQTNAARLAACGAEEAYYLAGGIEAWKAAGFPVRTS